MNQYQIFTDSSCDIPIEQLKKNNITLIPFYVSFDHSVYQKEIIELPLKDFYKRMTETEVFPKTSLPSVDDYISYFTPVLESGDDILCFCLSSKFSGSYQAACTAKMILSETYEEERIAIIDTQMAASVIGLLLFETLKMKKDGLSLPETVTAIQTLIPTGRVFFTLDTLEYLQKGGRIGKIASLAGTLLNLKPLIILENGELSPYGKVRGQKKAYNSILEMTKEYFNQTNHLYDDYSFCVLTGINDTEAEMVKEKLEQLTEQKIEFPVFHLGATIGTYTGPNLVGICLIKKYHAKNYA